MGERGRAAGGVEETQGLTELLLPADTGWSFFSNFLHFITSPPHHLTTTSLPSPAPPLRRLDLSLTPPSLNSHAAVWGLIPGFQNAKNERSYPVVAMVANLSKPSPSKPALMKHQDVVTVCSAGKRETDAD